LKIIPIELDADPIQSLKRLFKILDSYKNGTLSESLINLAPESNSSNSQKSKSLDITHSAGKKHQTPPHAHPYTLRNNNIKLVGKIEALPRILKKYEGNFVVLVLCKEGIFNEIKKIMETNLGNSSIICIISKADYNNLVFCKLEQNIEEPFQISDFILQWN
ncbi:MAG: hypothetical protein ACTSPQ_06920, partial [Candidatus Helarchaeota archaeon]